jgi:hypothetical protein
MHFRHLTKHSRTFSGGCSDASSISVDGASCRVVGRASSSCYERNGSRSGRCSGRESRANGWQLGLSWGGSRGAGSVGVDATSYEVMLVL